MIEDAVEDLIGLAMQALNLPDPEGDEQNGSNYGEDFSTCKLMVHTTLDILFIFSLFYFVLLLPLKRWQKVIERILIFL